MHEIGYFYIMSNAHNTVLYCGATIDLIKRVMEHKTGTFANSFTQRYNVCKLVYFQAFTNPSDAFMREKKIKSGSRKKKIDLIVAINPGWNDLFHQIYDGGITELSRLKKHFK